MGCKFQFLPPTRECGKVMFLLCLSVHIDRGGGGLVQCKIRCQVQWGGGLGSWSSSKSGGKFVARSGGGALVPGPGGCNIWGYPKTHTHPKNFWKFFFLPKIFFTFVKKNFLCEKKMWVP